MFKIPLFGLSSVFYTSCTKKEPYLFIGKTHKFKNCLNLMTLIFWTKLFKLQKIGNFLDYIKIISWYNTLQLGGLGFYDF